MLVQISVSGPLSTFLWAAWRGPWITLCRLNSPSHMTASADMNTQHYYLFPITTFLATTPRLFSKKPSCYLHSWVNAWWFRVGFSTHFWQTRFQYLLKPWVLCLTFEFSCIIWIKFGKFNQNINPFWHKTLHTVFVHNVGSTSKMGDIPGKDIIFIYGNFTQTLSFSFSLEFFNKSLQYSILVWIRKRCGAQSFLFDWGL